MVAFWIEAAALTTVALLWYGSISGMLATGRANPKRPALVALVLAASAVGIGAKLQAYAGGAVFDKMIWLHALNAAFVLADTQLAALFARRDADLEAAEEGETLLLAAEVQVEQDFSHGRKAEFASA